MGDGFQINGFIKIKQYKKDGTVIRDEKLYNKVTDIGRQWFLHKGSSPILQNNFANFSQSDFYSHMDCDVTDHQDNNYNYDRYKIYKKISAESATNYLFNLPQELYNLHHDAGGAKNFIGDKNTTPTIMGYASTNADQQAIADTAAKQGLVINTSSIPIVDDFRVGQTWRYPEGCATGTINAIAMMQSNFEGNRPSLGFAKCLTPRILNAASDVGDVQGYIPPDVVYNRGQSDEKIWTKPNEVIAHTSGNHTYRIELDTGKCTELKPSELGYNKDFIVPGMAAYFNCTLYGVNKILCVAYKHNNIQVISISETDITVSQGSATTSSSSDTSGTYQYLNTGKEIISMFSRVVSGERHIFVIGNYYYKNNSSSTVPAARYFVSEWKIDGTRVSISQALEFKAALSNATGADYSTVDDYLLGIIDAGDKSGYIALTKFVHISDTYSDWYNNIYDFNVMCGRYFSDIANYANTLTDRALILGGLTTERSSDDGIPGAAVFVMNTKLCAVSFRGRSRRISKYEGIYNITKYDYNVATLSFSKEGWAGNLISMKLLKDPIVKDTDDILDITYGYEIGEKNDA